MKLFVPDKQAYKLFHEATIALSQIEANGIRVDEDYLQQVIESTAVTIKELGEKLRDDNVFRLWRKRFGKKMNLTSPYQLAEIVFKQLGYHYKEPPKPLDRRDDREDDRKKEKKSKRLKADESMFADVDLPFVKTYFEMRKLDKVLGTYLLGMQREIIDGFVHPNFNLHFVITYRSSSDQPNFQNIPKRNPVMAEIIRRCYIARNGFQLGEIDFSGAEVRVAACYNKDPVLIRYIKDPTTDMHRDMAAELFMLDKEYLIRNKDWAKKSVRDWAKNRFVFPSFYGSVYFQTAPDLWSAVVRDKRSMPEMDITIAEYLASKGIKKLGNTDPGADTKPHTFVHHVKQVEKDFWEKRFSVYQDWKRSWWGKYLKTGGFRMYTGFVCWGTFKRNDVLNYAVQGSAFHCLLWSLVKIQRWLVKNNMQTKIVGQIHDSIVADIHPDERDDFLAKCKQVMTVDLLNHWDWLIVPMEIEAELSPINGNWYEIEKVKLP